MPPNDALVLVPMAIGAILLIRYWRTALQFVFVLAITSTCYVLLNVAKVMQG